MEAWDRRFGLQISERVYMKIQVPCRPLTDGERLSVHRISAVLPGDIFCVGIYMYRARQMPPGEQKEE